MAARRAPQRTMTYVDGNTVRRVEPEFRPERRQAPAHSPRIREQVRRNQDRALSIDLPYVLMLSVAAICALVICVNYLHQPSSMQARLSWIETLGQPLDDQTRETKNL